MDDRDSLITVLKELCEGQKELIANYVEQIQNYKDIENIQKKQINLLLRILKLHNIPFPVPNISKEST